MAEINNLSNGPPKHPAPSTNEPLHGGFTRFELELEFVTLLASPPYLSHLATTKLLQQPTFVAYLKYLLYWTQPAYVKYLSYPGPTLKALELLQQEDFRRDVLRPDVVGRLAEGFLNGMLSDG
ncbi:suppressor of hpr1 [Xylographa carneopallida]|nr:suppressor of hpr1 [Xylographa carneopallida]